MRLALAQSLEDRLAGKEEIEPQDGLVVGDDLESAGEEAGRLGQGVHGRGLMAGPQIPTASSHAVAGSVVVAGDETCELVEPAGSARCAARAIGQLARGMSGDEPSGRCHK